MELSKHLIGYFTGIYFFRPKTIGFGDALTCWCMFYLKKDLKNPHSGIREPINTFMATNILGYHSI